MLNYETLLSSYDDKLPLMQWLKKVEEALKDASAVSFNVNKRGDATLTFSVVFEDGSEIETGPITLQQGESVQAATIRNGHLILTLTNGDELDAGDLGGVSGFSIDASQHLIVTYQNGTTQDLGAIFTGDVTLQNIHVTGNILLEGNLDMGGNLQVVGGIHSNTTIEGAKLTGDEIVEKMTGYEYNRPQAQSGINQTLVYAGIVKNGNKLTFVLAEKIERVGTISGNYVQMGNFRVPVEVADKINPVNIGGGLFVDLKEVTLMEGFNSNKKCNCYCQKSASYLPCEFFITDINNVLTLNQEYYLRYEVTLLLSDNLGA